MLQSDADIMDCPVCLRAPSSRLPFLCTTCARNELYELRLHNTESLLQKETYGYQIAEKAARPGSKVQKSQPKLGTQDSSDGGIQLWAAEHSIAAKEQSAQRTAAILDHTQALKNEIKQIRTDISTRRVILAQRRSDIARSQNQLSERRTAALSGVEKSIKRTEHLWGSLHAQTAQSRSFLCSEAATLYGLRQRKRKKAGTIREEYAIGTVGIVDLRDMNSASPATISTCYANVAHLLVLISHYLSLRLPAEITLPRRGYPLPTIFAPGSSYLNRDVPFPGTTPSHSSTNSPTASRMGDVRPLPRPRPLFIHKRLQKLVREDPAGYALFLEGVTLLAWDVAWMCRVQGLNIGSSWEDVCAIGRNLWLLVASSTPPSPLPRRVSSREVTLKQVSERDTSAIPPPSSLRKSRSQPILGQYSHGTAHSFLKSVDGAEFMRGWRFQSHLKVFDKLKAALLGEMTNAEWELVEEKEWDDGGHQFNEDEAVLIRTKPSEGAQNPHYEAMSMFTAPTVRDDDSNTPDDSEPGKVKGTSGWTKLKPR